MSHKFEPQLCHITLMEIDYEIIPTVVLHSTDSEGQVSLTGKCMYSKNWAQLFKTNDVVS